MIKTPLSTVIGGAFWTPGATVIGGNTPTFDQQIQKLFANGEQGFFYDTNDLSTMYQDAVGTIPVTGVGQPVGLALDKSKGLVLGGETCSDPQLDNAAAWTMTEPAITISDGAARYTDTTGSSYIRNVSNAIPAGALVKVTIMVLSFTSGGLRVRVGTGSLVSFAISGAGTYSVYCFSGGTSSHDLMTIGTTTCVVGSISIKELHGNHAYQTTSALRPILRDTPRRIDFDAVDDKLITNLPAQLTDCTVIRSVPNVGTQILTGQTIPATYEDNADHCGLILINRALTPSETSAIAAEFNKRAGV